MEPNRDREEKKERKESSDNIITMEIKQLTDADRNRIKVIVHFMPSWHEQIPYKYGDNCMLLVVLVIVIEAVI